MPSQLSPEELRTEIDILKLKMMLEYGAEFFNGPGIEELDPGIEHQFLTQVREFHNNIKEGKNITVWEKIGFPEHFPKVSELFEAEIPDVIRKMQTLLMKHGIHFSVISPNVTPREIYRFLTEEFPSVEVPDFPSPGIYCFVYDEFHPDPYYECEYAAVKGCIGKILNMDCSDEQMCSTEFVSLNQYHDIPETEFMEYIKKFRTRFSSIKNIVLEAKKTYVSETGGVVKGYHETGLCTGTHCFIAKGSWQVNFVPDDDNGWLISSVQIEGIHF